MQSMESKENITKPREADGYKLSQHVIMKSYEFSAIQRHIH